MGISRSQGFTRVGIPDSGNSYGLTGNSAYQKSLDQMGSFNTFSLSSNNRQSRNRNGGNGYGMPDITPRYAYDEAENRSTINVDAATDVADKLKDYGDKLFDVFDNYQTNFQYLGDNATVSDAQLQSRLGEASSDYQANADLQQAEYERDMRRMGVNPTRHGLPVLVPAMPCTRQRDCRPFRTRYVILPEKKAGTVTWM